MCRIVDCRPLKDLKDTRHDGIKTNIQENKEGRGGHGQGGQADIQIDFTLLVARHF